MGHIFQLLNGKPLKLVDHFIYLGSNISSTENDVNIYLGKAWIDLDRLLTIWKSDLSDKREHEFFQAVAVPVLLHGCTPLTVTKHLENYLDGDYTKMLCAVLNKS